MRKVAFLARGFDQFNQWAIQDKKIYSKIVTLIKDNLELAEREKQGLTVIGARSI